MKRLFRSRDRDAAVLSQGIVVLVLFVAGAKAIVFFETEGERLEF